jgi:hypothetical protein
MTAADIAAVVSRRRTTVRGDVVSVESYERPWVRTDAEVTDGTGCLLLRFVGLGAVPGVVACREIEAEGTPASLRGILVMLNPRYLFPSPTPRPPPAGSRCPGWS